MNDNTEEERGTGRQNVLKNQPHPYSYCVYDNQGLKVCVCECVFVCVCLGWGAVREKTVGKWGKRDGVLKKETEKGKLSITCCVCGDTLKF